MQSQQCVFVGIKSFSSSFGIHLGLVYKYILVCFVYPRHSKVHLFQQRLLQSCSGQAQSKALKAGEVGWLGFYKCNFFFPLVGLESLLCIFISPLILSWQKPVCWQRAAYLHDLEYKKCKYTVMTVFSHNSATVKRLRLCQSGKKFPTSASYQC